MKHKAYVMCLAPDSILKWGFSCPAVPCYVLIVFFHLEQVLDCVYMHPLLSRSRSITMLFCSLRFRLPPAFLKASISSSFFSYLDPTFLPADINGLLTVQLLRWGHAASLPASPRLPCSTTYTARSRPYVAIR